MTIKLIARSIIPAIFFCLNILGEASATSVSSSCVVKGTTRSSISVVGSGLTGNFYSIVLSGGRYYWTKAKPANTNGIVAFSFDSNSTATLAGATAIPSTFIKNNTVDVYVRRAGTNVFVGGIRTTCVVK